MIKLEEPGQAYRYCKDVQDYLTEIKSKLIQPVHYGGPAGDVTDRALWGYRCVLCGNEDKTRFTIRHSPDCILGCFLAIDQKLQRVTRVIGAVEAEYQLHLGFQERYQALLADDGLDFSVEDV